MKARIIARIVVLTVSIPLLGLVINCDVKRFMPGGKEEPRPGFAMKAEQMVGAAADIQPAPMEAEVADRQIIRRGYLTIEVKRVEKAVKTATDIAKKLGGFVSDSRSYEDDAGRKLASLTLRVPAKRLDEAMGQLKAMGRVRDERLSGEDVTEQYFDLKARLSNARRLERRLLTLLEKKTKNVKDLLDVERELGRVRQQIESLEGRKRFLDDRLRLATIELELTEPRGWGRGVFDPLSGTIFNALSAFTTSLAVLIVVISAAVPWIVIFVLAAWLVIRSLRWLLRRKREAKEKGRGPKARE